MIKKKNYQTKKIKTKKRIICKNWKEVIDNSTNDKVDQIRQKIRRKYENIEELKKRYLDYKSISMNKQDGVFVIGC